MWRGLPPAPRAAPARWAVLCVPQRYQRDNTASRPRHSSWRQKTAKYERAVKAQQQEESARAADTKRLRRRTQGSGTRGKEKEDPAVTGEEAADSTEAHDRVREPYFGFLPSLFMSYRKSQREREPAPLNPLHTLSRSSDSAHTNRLLEAMDSMRRQTERHGAQPAVTLDEARRNEVAYEYIRERWYSFLYRPFRHWPDRRIKWIKRGALGVTSVLVVIELIIAYNMYLYEMRCVQAMSPEDRADYTRMTMGMRYSDIVRAGQEELARVDPNEVLPPAARSAIVVEACRSKGWHKVDWETEARERYPNSALRDGDFTHLFYWAFMFLGNAMTGGGAYYSSVIFNSTDLQRQQRQQEVQEGFVEAGPETQPTSRPRRSFFS